MVVPPDYHEDQRLLTHKIRVSGCDVDTERSYDTFGNVVLDLSLEHVEREATFTTWAVVEREAAVDGKDTPDAISVRPALRRQLAAHPPRRRPPRGGR